MYLNHNLESFQPYCSLLSRKGGRLTYDYPSLTANKFSVAVNVRLFPRLVSKPSNRIKLLDLWERIHRTLLLLDN